MAPVVDKMKEARQMVWTCARRCVQGMRRGWSRLKMYWGELIRQHMVNLHITEDMTIDRKEQSVILPYVALVPVVGLVDPCVLDICSLVYFDYHTILMLFFSCRLYTAFLINRYPFFHCFLLFLLGLDALESKVFQKQPLYLHEVMVRSAYTTLFRHHFVRFHWVCCCRIRQIKVLYHVKSV